MLIVHKASAQLGAYIGGCQRHGQDATDFRVLSAIQQGRYGARTSKPLRRPQGSKCRVAF